MKNILLACFVVLMYSCQSGKDNPHQPGIAKNNNTDSSAETVADNATILSKKEVPILCYHHIRNFTSGGRLKEYEVLPSSFAAQMKALNDSGYHTILPDDLYNYLVHNKELPSKPVMLTFDDNDKEQYTIGAAEMQKYG